MLDIWNVNFSSRRLLHRIKLLNIETIKQIIVVLLLPTWRTVNFQIYIVFAVAGSTEIKKKNIYIISHNNIFIRLFIITLY